MRKRTAFIAILVSFYLLVVSPVWGQTNQDIAPLRVRVFPHQVMIDLGYHGTSLFLFGVAPLDTDIVLKMQGPILLQKANRQGHLGGLLWMPMEQIEIAGLPSFFYVLSSRPLDDILPVELQRNLAVDSKNIGLRRQVSLRRIPSDIQIKGQPFDQFMDELIGLEQSKQHFVWDEGSVKITGPDFEAVMQLPADTTPGSFDVQVIAIRNREVVSTSHTNLQVRKSGFVDTLAAQAEFNSLMTGLLSVILPALAGFGVAGLFGMRGGR